MAAAHLSDERNLALMAAVLTACGYTVKGDAIGGTLTPAAAVATIETELALAEIELQTDHEPMLHVFANNAKPGTMGPYAEAMALKVTRALAIVD